MRKPFFLSIVFVLCLISSSSKGSGQARPIPPGVREADNQINAQINEPPAKFKRKPTEPAKLLEEADELAKLSAAIPGQIELVRKGQFPKDLEEHLKLSLIHI